MQQEFMSKHEVDADGNPAGGISEATGISIQWQNGPLGRGENRAAPNGAFVETVLDIAIDRLQHYQMGRFGTTYNTHAILSIREAIAHLNARTADRETRGVEGTHTV